MGQLEDIRCQLRALGAERFRLRPHEATTFDATVRAGGLDSELERLTTALGGAQAALLGGIRIPDRSLLAIVDRWAKLRLPASPLQVSPEPGSDSAGMATNWGSTLESEGGAVLGKSHETLSDAELKRLVTRDQLLSAFPILKKEWFRDFGDRKWLADAKKVRGTPGRNGKKPLFCPYLVMIGLTTEARRQRLPVAQGWRLLEVHFPDSYQVFEVNRPGRRRESDD